MYRTSIILLHTFREVIAQPIYSLVLVLGTVVLVTFGALPFFTLGDDTVMFKSVGLDVILILVLIATLFATSKSIYEEIEDRTMLTLMSKPVQKWEVLVGKYLGICLASLLAIALLGVVICLCTWSRIPGDYQLRVASLDDRDRAVIWGWRAMHLSGLIPSLLLAWLQVSVLAAVSVAVSTRVSLVVNLPGVILIYLAGNLTRFLFPMAAGTNGPLSESSFIVKGFAYLLATIIPFLENFDMRDKAIYSKIAIPGTQFATEINAVSLGSIWGYVAIASAYAVAYAVFALAAGMLLFQSRELGGGEG